MEKRHGLGLVTLRGRHSSRALMSQLRLNDERVPRYWPLGEMLVRGIIRVHRKPLRSIHALSAIWTRKIEEVESALYQRFAARLSVLEAL